MKLYRLFFSVVIIVFSLVNSIAQEYSAGWKGENIIASADFYNSNLWTANVSDAEYGDSMYITADSALYLHWKFGTGALSKWTQAYMVLPEPLDLADNNLIGLDIKGTDTNSPFRNVEVKFEDGSTQAVFIWENMAHIYRWCNNVTLLKNQFSNANSIRWDSVTVVSFAIHRDPADNADTLKDEGILCIRNMMVQSTDSFVTADSFEPLNLIDPQVLDDINSAAAEAILNRQTDNGLIVTWEEDGTSWLYGQGMALYILTREGNWTEEGIPENDFAMAAEKMAHFMANQQFDEGYWPRSWIAESGHPRNYIESDSTIWMGDFPWIPGSLAFYFRKSGDVSVLNSILKAGSLLNELIEGNSGKVNTINIETGIKKEVPNYEGYAATIFYLLQIEDTATAGKVVDYLNKNGWDQDLKYFREGPGTQRPVLLVNAWLAAIYDQFGYHKNALDALSLVGKILYTCGTGEPCGMDGVGPIATWYEGTLSYIAARGPGSNMFFEGIVPFINEDGTVPAYNDDLGVMAGNWIISWSSLDATSWLYFASAQTTPFEIPDVDPGIFVSEGKTEPVDMNFRFFNKRFICIPPQGEPTEISLYSLDGIEKGSTVISKNDTTIDINDLSHSFLFPGIYIVVILNNNTFYSQKIIYMDQ